MRRTLLALALAMALLAVAATLLILHGAGGRPPGAAPSRGPAPGGPPRESPPGHARSTAAGSQPCTGMPQPGTCGFPDAGDAGVPAGTVLRAVPGQVTSGPGWSWVPADREVDVTGSGVTLSRLAIAGTLNIMASRVLVEDVAVSPDPAAAFGISLRTVSSVTIEDTSVTGRNAGGGRMGAGICDVYGTSAGIVISHDNIANFKTAIQLSTGQITSSFIHNPGYASGDHTNGILDLGTTQPLTISHNTILISLGQTDAISLDAAGGGRPVANKTITGNLLGGGSYTIYGGTSHGNATRNINISGNVFSQAYYPSSGKFGAAAYFAMSGPGNVWARNTWGTSGSAIGFDANAVARCDDAQCAGVPAGAGQVTGRA